MKKFTSLMALAITLLFAINTPSQANDHKKSATVGDLVITKIWARTTPKTAKTGAAFFMIKNNGKTDDTLIDASSTLSKKTEIHQSSMENGIMKMRHVGKIAVPAGAMVLLKPGSFHIMFMGLYGPINEGDEFPLNLSFEKAGSVKIMVKAQKSTTKGAMDHSKMKKTTKGAMDHSKMK